jgi:hypothetical protein
LSWQEDETTEEQKKFYVKEENSRFNTFFVQHQKTFRSFSFLHRFLPHFGHYVYKNARAGNFFSRAECVYKKLHISQISIVVGVWLWKFATIEWRNERDQNMVIGLIDFDHIYFSTPPNKFSNPSQRWWWTSNKKKHKPTHHRINAHRVDFFGK